MRSKDMNRLPTEKQQQNYVNDDESSSENESDDEEVANESGNKNKKDKVQWEKPKSNATPAQIKILIGLAVKAAIKAIMKNHSFQVNNKILQQSRKGIQGLDLMRALAKLYMIEWTEKFMQKLKLIQENMKYGI